ncbi:hypothetical protein HMPREF3150_01255 [Pseudomonas aeruginosa]|nr:hypothetical protein HMPREF3150_01255 [Pseudomonas aeruginosa]
MTADPARPVGLTCPGWDVYMAAIPPCRFTRLRRGASIRLP